MYDASHLDSLHQPERRIRAEVYLPRGKDNGAQRLPFHCAQALDQVRHPHPNHHHRHPNYQSS